MGFESSHGLQRLVAGEATWWENRTNAAELPGVDVATVSRRLPMSNALRVDGSTIRSLMQLERQVRPDAYG